jgi:exopolysaccharide production protein ExoZ
LFEFLFGMLLARWYSKGLPRMPALLPWVLAAIGLIVLFFGLPFLHLPLGSLQQEMLENGLPAALIVFAVLCLENGLKRHPVKFLAYLGDASYSIYLGHLFCLGAARFLWMRAGLYRGFLPDAVAFAIFGIALTILGTIMIYRWLELPMLGYFQRIYRQHRAVRSARAQRAALNRM